jgi:hypothetical protein
MYLSKKELLIKFPQLEKFKNQKWLEEEAIKSDCNYKELPLKAALELINDVIIFIDRTKFNSNWEAGFSTKTRLEQIRNLLQFFCEDNILEKTIKGTDIILKDPIH